MKSKMQRRSALYIALVLCWVNQVQSQTNLEKPSEVNVAPSVSTGAQDHRVYKGLTVRGNGGASVMSNTIQGIGMNSKLPSTLGSVYGGELNYGFKNSNTNLFLKYSSSTVRYEDVAGVRPSSFNLKNARTDVGFLIGDVGSKDEGISTFGIGYYLVERSADRVSPVVAGTSYISGVTFSVGFANSLSEKTFYESGITLGFPHSFQEGNTVTGRYKFGLSAMLNLKVVYVYTPDIDLALGVDVNYDMVSFAGSGASGESRGVADATEQFTNYMVPVEVRFKF